MKKVNYVIRFVMSMELQRKTEKIFKIELKLDAKARKHTTVFELGSMRVSKSSLGSPKG